MLQIPLLAAVAAVAAIVTAPAAAQNNALTVYGGWRGGGSFDGGTSSNASATLDSSFAGSASLDWAIDASRQVQLFGSVQSTDLPAFAGNPAVPMRVTYLHLGGTNFFDGAIGRGVYVVGGLGATWLAPDLAGLSNEVRPSLNVGIGWQWPVAPSISLRFELRGYLTLMDSSSRMFCSGSCAVWIEGDLMTQGEAMVGVSFGF